MEKLLKGLWKCLGISGGLSERGDSKSPLTGALSHPLTDTPKRELSLEETPSLAEIFSFLTSFGMTTLFFMSSVDKVYLRF